MVNALLQKATQSTDSQLTDTHSQPERRLQADAFVLTIPIVLEIVQYCTEDALIQPSVWYIAGAGARPPNSDG